MVLNVSNMIENDLKNLTYVHLVSIDELVTVIFLWGSGHISGNLPSQLKNKFRNMKIGYTNWKILRSIKAKSKECGSYTTTETKSLRKY